MSIRLSCDNCGRTYNLKDELAGRKFRCRECSTMIQIPDNDGIEEYFADEDLSDDDWRPTAALPPVAGGGRRPTRDGPGTTAPLSPTRPKKKKRRKKRISFPVARITSGIVVLLAVGFLVMFVVEFTKGVRQQIAAQRPDWQEYSVPGQPISIEMPATPEPVSRFQNGTLIQGAMGELGKNIGDAGGVFVIMYGDHGFEPGKFFDVDDWFQWRAMMMTQSMISSNSTRFDEKTISITDRGGNVHPGREYRMNATVSMSEFVMICRIYLVGEQAVCAFTGVSAKREDELEERSTHFLNSLQITDSVPPLAVGQKPAARTVQPPSDRPASGF